LALIATAMLGCNKKADTAVEKAAHGPRVGEIRNAR
jgi:hypothetical protein